MCVCVFLSVYVKCFISTAKLRLRFSIHAHTCMPTYVCMFALYPTNLTLHHVWQVWRKSIATTPYNFFLPAKESQGNGCS